MKTQHVRLTALLTVCLLLTSCGKGVSATTMHLRQTEGTVSVQDGAGKPVLPLKNLGLYSGYGVSTAAQSYAWIDLDHVKLTKLDQDSAAAIHKKQNFLTVEVKAGSLFFHVTQPLDEDETLEIRTSTMLVGIRGTCGWVTASEDGSTMQVWLLEGTVSCEAGENKKTVQAGERAVMTEDGEITVSGFAREDIPAFVWDEVEDEEELLSALPGGGGAPETPEPGDDGPSEPPPQSGPPAYSGTGGDVAWTLSEEGVLTFSGTGAIPGYESMSDWSRDCPWHSNELAEVRAVVIGDGITGIGDYAFHLCTELSSVTIPDSVTLIGTNAFGYCRSLASVALPDSVTTIQNGAFYGCTALTSIRIPDGVTAIGVDAFHECAALTSIRIPEGVTAIEASTFTFCRRLTSITLPKSITRIDDSAFYNCESLTDIYYAGTREDFQAISIGNWNESHNGAFTDADIHYSAS